MSLIACPRVLKAVRRIGGVAALVFLASTGTALAACPPQPVSTPFSQWGDSANYFLAPGGSFEGTADQVGWSLSNASLTSGNEPFNVNASGDTQSLTVTAGGSATSPYFCVDNTMSAMRFFAQQVTTGGDLKVEAVVQTPRGTRTVPLSDLADGSMTAWGPTQSIPGDTSSMQDGESIMVALRFEVPAPAGSWQIDDVYVDPYRAG